ARRFRASFCATPCVARLEGGAATRLSMRTLGGRDLAESPKRNRILHLTGDSLSASVMCRCGDQVEGAARIPGGSPCAVRNQSIIIARPSLVTGRRGQNIMSEADLYAPKKEPPSASLTFSSGWRVHQVGDIRPGGTLR